MEAAGRWSIGRWGIVALLVVSTLMAVDCPLASAQNARTANFLVHAPTQELAETVARQAETCRDELAVYWLGKPLQPWPTPCPIEVVSGPHLAAQGATTYNRSPVGNFQMRVIGSRERILDSVLPHEVTHTVMATHFGQPLPRWADEGICTTVEHSAERNKHEVKLREYLSTRRGIPMNHLFGLKEYPQDMLPMYAQGYSVCRFLIEQSGPRQFIAFLEDYMKSNAWTPNVQSHYGYDSLRQLQDQWLAWVAGGSGPVESFVSARNAAPVALTASAPSAPIASTPDPASLVAGPTSGSESWYQRRREQTARGPNATLTSTPPTNSGSEPASHPDPVSPATVYTPAAALIGPPSVTNSGRYSVSQPQSEQSYGAAVGGRPLEHSASRYR